MAKFLIDASLPRPTAALVGSYSHTATDVRNIGMAAASDQAIAAYAQANQMIILTKDQDFGNILNYPPDQYYGIAPVDAPAGAGRAAVLGLVEQLLRQKDVVENLSGRLAVIQAGRIRLRPPP
jgi:hypothetical protein